MYPAHSAQYHTHIYNRRDGLMYKVIRVCANSVLRSIEYLSPPISKLVTTLCVFLTWCSWYFWEIFLPDAFLVSVFYDRHCRQYSHLFVLARHGRSKTYFWLLSSVSIIICDWLSLQAHMFFKHICFFPLTRIWFRKCLTSWFYHFEVVPRTKWCGWHLQKREAQNHRRIELRCVYTISMES